MIQPFSILNYLIFPFKHIINTFFKTPNTTSIFPEILINSLLKEINKERMLYLTSQLNFHNIPESEEHFTVDYLSDSF